MKECLVTQVGLGLNRSRLGIYRMQRGGHNGGGRAQGNSTPGIHLATTQRTWEGFRRKAGEKRLRAKPECAKDMDFGGQWESSIVTTVTEKRSLFGLC